jgi:hypothetical protein
MPSGVYEANLEVMCTLQQSMQQSYSSVVLFTFEFCIYFLPSLIHIQEHKEHS